MSASEKWSDLAARLGSAIAMVLVGAFGIWMGGDLFYVLVAIVCGLMAWELVGMLRPDARGIQILLGGLTAIALLLSAYLPIATTVALLLVPVLIGSVILATRKLIYIAYTVAILLTGISIMQLRGEMGPSWMLWLVLVVIVTDVFGYFAGRMLGGPKFWPAISPKKTWSGTAAGWVGAAVVGALFALYTGSGMQLVLLSVLISFASQIGDIAESAIKRKTGVKDSSNLIPGHGGLMDRFDGMIGASVFLLLIGYLIGFPIGLG